MAEPTPALGALTPAQEASLRARCANEAGWGVWQCDRSALGALLDAYDARGREIDAQAARLAAQQPVYDAAVAYVAYGLGHPTLGATPWAGMSHWETLKAAVAAAGAAGEGWEDG